VGKVGRVRAEREELRRISLREAFLGCKAVEAARIALPSIDPAPWRRSIPSSYPIHRLEKSVVRPKSSARTNPSVARSRRPAPHPSTSRLSSAKKPLQHAFSGKARKHGTTPTVPSAQSDHDHPKKTGVNKLGEAGRTTVDQVTRIARRVGRQRSATKTNTRTNSAMPSASCRSGYEDRQRPTVFSDSENKNQAARGLIRFRFNISTKVVRFNPSRPAACFLFHFVRSSACLIN
jgi:hypothetical protein